MGNRVLAFVAVATLTTVTPVTSQDSPPPSEQASRMEDLVDRAAALVEARGESALAEFRRRGSEWWFGSTYLFAYDQDLNVLLNPAFPEREGTNPSGETDVNGKAFHDAFLSVATTRGAGWVDYMFPKPGETEPSQKWSYVRSVDIDGTPGIIGAGFYPR